MNLGKALTRALGRTGLALVGLLALLSILARTPGPQGRWAHNTLVGVDLFANALMLGDPRETISSRLGKWKTGEHRGRRIVATTVCPALSVLMVEADHCVRSIDEVNGRRAVAP